ncbi:hypothetical protein GCM10017559_12090 [Streptosporangium longisporum]|uniref:Uncharacterized protein n=1 Tax=Streptosporangium longisporum TaxID=46187 RepID=A0ABP6KCG4_9ACTN
MQAQSLDQVGDLAAAELLDGLGQRLRQRLLTGVADPQDADPEVLLGQVGEVEVAGEGPGDVHGAVDGPFGHHRGDLVDRDLPAARPDDGLAQSFDIGEQVIAAVFGDDLPEEFAEQPHVRAQLVGHLGDSGGTLCLLGHDGGHARQSTDRVSTGGDRSHPLD